MELATPDIPETKVADGERRRRARQRLYDQLNLKGDIIASRECLAPLAMLADLVGQLLTARTPQPWTRPTPLGPVAPTGFRPLWSRRQSHQQPIVEQHHQQHSDLSDVDEELKQALRPAPMTRSGWPLTLVAP